MKVTVVILTLNEARHIERALLSVQSFAYKCVVVDSGSSDDTVARAEALGAKVLTHPFVNQASQFNWALEQLPKDTGWVFRLDADEVVSESLSNEIVTRLPSVPSEVAGLTVARRIAFLRRPIRYGGVFPLHVLRLFRFGRGQSEDRWMDEHISVQGRVGALSGEILDDNLNPVSWWIDKHNQYASREVIELLKIERLGHQPENVSSLGPRAATKRWLKRYLYGGLPSGLRALAYFLYRYVLRLGFMDGREGAVFHVLQAFWYRYLVDAKLFEIRLHMRRTGTNTATAIRDLFGIDVGT